MIELKISEVRPGAIAILEKLKQELSPSGVSLGVLYASANGTSAVALTDIQLLKLVTLMRKNTQRDTVCEFIKHIASLADETTAKLYEDSVK